MNGVHDMGGMHGFGPIEYEANEPRFHAAWEAHVAAINNRARRGLGLYNNDEFRYGIEQMQPGDYLRASYFERWLASIEYNLVQKGILSRGELDARIELLRDQLESVLPSRVDAAPPRHEPTPGSDAHMPGIEPLFVVGDAVVTRNAHPNGHSRLPRYVRGKRGVIHRVNGPEIFPDTHAHGLGEHPQVVYSVRFDGRELWGDSAEPRQMLYIDLWESYLEPSSS
jgi:nitrile hydratase